MESWMEEERKGRKEGRKGAEKAESLADGRVSALDPPSSLPFRPSFPSIPNFRNFGIGKTLTR